MSKKIYGNMGRVLHLDMTSKSFQIEDLSEEASRTIAIRTSPDEFRREVVATRYGAMGKPALAGAAEKVYAGYRRLHRMLQQGQARYGVLRARMGETP